MVWTLLLVSLAAAEPALIANVAPPVPVGVDGRHARPFLGPDGLWHLGHGRSGRFHDVVLDENLLARIDTARILVDGDGRFVDHALAACPDGTLLHSASGNLVEPDDTAWATLISADLEPGPTVALVEREPELATNDMAALCTAEARLVAVAGSGILEYEVPSQNWLFPVTDAVLDGEEPERLPLHEAPRVNGTSLVWDTTARQLLVLGMPGGGSLQIAAYDESFAPVGRTSTNVDLPDGVQAYWSAAAAPVGDGYAIVHMGRQMEQGFAQDTGDVFLTVADRSFFFKHTVRITNLEPPNGAMRPGLAVRGGELLIAWDQEGRFSATRAEVDLDALARLAEALPQDTAEPSVPGEASDTNDAPRSPMGTEGNSGCRTVPWSPPPALFVASLFLLGRRRCGP